MSNENYNKQIKSKGTLFRSVVIFSLKVFLVENEALEKIECFKTQRIKPLASYIVVRFHNQWQEFQRLNKNGNMETFKEKNFQSVKNIFYSNMIQNVLLNIKAIFKKS